jgi:hypothetical protein
MERNLRSLSPRFEFVIAVFGSDCPAVSPLLLVYDIDRVEILAFTGEGVEILREIITSRTRSIKPTEPRTAAPQCLAYAYVKLIGVRRIKNWGR